MATRWIRSIFALAALAAACTLQAEGLLRAGLSKVDITPGVSMPMYGYRNRSCGPSSGVHDPLFAKILVLEAGDSRMAILTVDLGTLMSEKLRRDLAEKLGIPLVLMAASHTHSGPLFLPASDEAPSAPSPYLAEIEEKIFGAVQAATRSMFPARFTVGRGAIQLGYNRLQVGEDGRARAVFNNLERIPYGPVDPEYMLLGVEDQSGKLRALLVHYACHSVVLGPSNCKYSADYPGVLQAVVEKSIPGLQCMFVQGAAGDINPLFLARTKNEEQDFAIVRKMGETLAGAVLRSVKSMQPAEPVLRPIRFVSERLTFSERWDKTKKVEVGITTVLLSPSIAIAAMPGEALHKLQRMWKEQADVAWPFFYGYTWSAGGGWPGYIPDLRSAAYGGYGADNATRIEVGAGEMLLLRHLIHLYQLQGRWLDQPGKP